MGAATRPVRSASRPALAGRSWVPALAASVLLHTVLVVGSYGLAKQWSRAQERTGQYVAQTMWLGSTDLAIEPIASHQPDPQPSPPAPRQPAPEPRTTEPAPRAMDRNPTPPLIEVTPGIDASHADTPSWIGAASSTEHDARRSTVDQPALTREQGTHGPERESRQEQAEREARETREVRIAQERRVESDDSEHEQPAQSAEQETVVAKPEQPKVELQDLPAAEIPALHNPVEPALVPARLREHVPTHNDNAGVESQEREEVTRSEGDFEEVEPVAGMLPQQPSGSPDRRPGVMSDRESTPSSREETLTFRPGMPLAREGLTIRPVLPRFSTTTRVLSFAARNPLIIITFNAKGKVVNAQYAPGRSTGSEEWDAPLLDSIYRWTASGRRLRELTRDDPEARLVLRVEYILNESARR